jgi:hypothetical protein
MNRMKKDQEGIIERELQKLPQVRPPSQLRTALSVMGSRECQAVLDTHGSRWRRLWQAWRFRLELLLNPLTLPATGGVFSSLVLFALLSLTIAGGTPPVGYEVPVIYADQNGTTLVPLQLRSEVMVTFSLDGSGHMTDYTVHDGSDSFVGAMTHIQDRTIPIPEFPSVLAVAQPISRDVSIRFMPLVFRQ